MIGKREFDWVLILGKAHNDEGIPSKRSAIHACAVWLHLVSYGSLDDDLLCAVEVRHAHGDEKLELLWWMEKLWADVVNGDCAVGLLQNPAIKLQDRSKDGKPQIGTGQYQDGNLEGNPVLNECAIVVNVGKTKDRDWMTKEMKDLSAQDWQQHRKLYLDGEKDSKKYFYQEGRNFTVGMQWWKEPIVYKWMRVKTMELQSVANITSRMQRQSLLDDDE